MLHALLDAFPDASREINNSHHASSTLASQATKRKSSYEEANDLSITTITDVGPKDLAAVRDAILLQLKKKQLNPQMRCELHAQLALGHLKDSKSDNAIAIQAIQDALKYGKGVITVASLVRLRDLFADYLVSDDELPVAYELIEGGLAEDAASGPLWFRKGVIHWEQHEFANAYSALAVALENQYEDDRSVFYMGAVLADWGNYEGAIGELSAVIDGNTRYGFSAMTKARAQSWLAYVKAKQGNWPEAKVEFEAMASSLENDAVHHYLRGVCQYENGEKRKAVTELTAAISESMHSPLNALKRERVASILKELKPARVYKKKKA